MTQIAVDDNGNELAIADNGKVMLHLKSEPRARAIGVIRDRVLHVDRNRDRHLHRKSNSYGFNYHVLQKDMFDHVSINESGTHYVVPKDVILADGKVMFFKKAKAGSFEVQIFLNLDTIKTYRKEQP